MKNYNNKWYATKSCIPRYKKRSFESSRRFKGIVHALRTQSNCYRHTKFLNRKTFTKFCPKKLVFVPGLRYNNVILGVNYMKKSNVINLIKYHVEKKENSFREEAINIARFFDSIGDDQVAEYIMGLLSDVNVFSPQSSIAKSEYLQQIDLSNLSSLYLPLDITKDLKGIINAVNHDIGINKFLFEGLPGSGKTEAVKQVARLLDRNLFYVDFENLLDSKLGQTNKNLTKLFYEIGTLPQSEKTIVLFDEIDVLALDRINNNDIREMGRVTSTVLRELDRLTDLNKDVIIIATTNLFENFDKALARRFDAIINFNRYDKNDLVEIGSLYFAELIKSFKTLSKDTRLFKKIMLNAPELPFPGELKNKIRTSLAFSDVDKNDDYLRMLYKNFIGNLDERSVQELHGLGFTIREIEKLTGESKSGVSRKLASNEV